MAAKRIQRFWSAVRGTFAGLVGQAADESGDGVVAKVGDYGAVKISEAVGASQYVSAAAEAVASLKATPGIIIAGMVYNQGGAVAYLQFHNLAAAPVGGETPAMVLGEIGAGDTVPWPCSVDGTVGLQVALSSTRDTFTAYANMRALLWVD